MKFLMACIYEYLEDGGDEVVTFFTHLHCLPSSRTLSLSIGLPILAPKQVLTLQNGTGNSFFDQSSSINLQHTCMQIDQNFRPIVLDKCVGVVSKDMSMTSANASFFFSLL